MAEVKDLLGLALRGVEPRHDDLEAVLRLAGRYRRGRRLVAATVALALTIGLAAALLAVVHRSPSLIPGAGGQIVGPTRVIVIPSLSMEPTLRPGDQVLVDEGAYRIERPARGDVVAFTVHDASLGPPGFVWVKRVIGLPGDVVRERSGRIYVNGRRVAMPLRGVKRDHLTLGPFNVGPGHLFVVGDNLANSNDSRFGLGQVPVRDVIGRVVEILGPESRVGGLSPPPAPAVSNPSAS